MAFSHGSAAILKVADSGAILRDLSSYLTSETLARTAEALDTTVQGPSVTSKSYLPGLKDGTIPLEGNFDPTVDGYLSGILAMTALTTFEFYPAGEPIGATKPKYSGSCMLSAYDVRTGVDGLAKITGTLQLSGTISRATS